MSDETDVRPGVGGAVRYGYVILTTYHTYLDLSSITDTGYFGYYSITHTIVCVILAKKQYHISIHGYYNVHGTPGSYYRTVPNVDETKISYLSTVTSNIQSQLNAK